MNGYRFLDFVRRRRLEAGGTAARMAALRELRSAGILPALPNEVQKQVADVR
jgi:hypothetical protein